MQTPCFRGKCSSITLHLNPSPPPYTASPHPSCKHNETLLSRSVGYFLNLLYIMNLPRSWQMKTRTKHRSRFKLAWFSGVRGRSRSRGRGAKGTENDLGRLRIRLGLSMFSLFLNQKFFGMNHKTVIGIDKAFVWSAKLCRSPLYLIIIILMFIQ